MLVIPKLTYESNRKAAQVASEPREANNIQPDRRSPPGGMDRMSSVGYMSMQSTPGRSSFLESTRNRHSNSIAPPVDKGLDRSHVQERTQSELR